MLSVMNYTCHCFLMSPRVCKQLNICEHVYPAVTVTSKTAVVFMTSLTGSVCVSVCRNTHSHMLPALSAHCSQTACHRPWARHILQLWCHHCETEDSSDSCFCFLVFSLANTHDPFADVTHGHDLTTDLSHSYFVMSPPLTLWSKSNTRWLIDCRWHMTVFKQLITALWGVQKTHKPKGRDKHVIMQTRRHKLCLLTWERD